MLRWWRDYRHRRASRHAEQWALYEREINEQSLEYRSLMAGIVRRVGAQFIASGAVVLNSEDDGERLQLTDVSSGSTIVEVEARWPPWKDVRGDFQGTITIRGADPADVYTVHAYDHLARRWYPTASEADSSWTAWWDVEFEDCVREVVEKR